MRNSGKSDHGLLSSLLPLQLLLQDELAALVRPANAGKKRHPEEVHPQALIRLNQGGDIAYHDVLDLHASELNRRRTGDPIRGGHSDDVIARGRMDTEARGVALAQRDL